MSAQHTPGPRSHLRQSGTRSVCRYSSRPSRRLLVLSIEEFASLPTESKCSECEAKFRAAIAKATGAAS